MNKKIALFLLGNILPQGLIAIVFIILAKLLTNQQFGELVLVDSIFQLMVVGFLLGNDKAVERLSFESEGGEKYNQNLLFGTIGVATIFLAITLITNTIFFETFQKIIKIDFLSNELMLGLVIASWLAAIFQLVQSYEYKRLNAIGVLLLKLSRALIYAAVLLYLIYHASPPSFSKVCAEIIALTAPLLVFWYLRTKDQSTAGLISFAPLKAAIALRDSLSYSLPFFLAVVSSISMSNLDKFFINKSLGAHELASYAIAQKFSLVFLMIAGGIAAITPPVFFRTFHENSNKAYLFADKILHIVFLGILFFSMSAQIVVPYIFPDTSKEILIYLIGILPGAYCSIIVSYGPVLCLLQDKRSFANMMTGIVTAGLNLIFLYFLIPLAGVWGAVISYSASMLFLLILQLKLIRSRHSDFPNGLRRVAILITVCFAFIFFVKNDYFWIEHSTLYFLPLMFFLAKSAISRFKYLS
ncbi:MAG: oligosaccharide flippase family protein [Paucibacter sp.]|nr:oligosaccharide flippase family protein [Roseateles sp.]